MHCLSTLTASLSPCLVSASLSPCLALSQHHVMCSTQSHTPHTHITLVYHALSQHHSRVPCFVLASLSCAMPCLSITLVCLALSQHHSHVPCLVSASLSCAMPCLSITLVCLALSQHHSHVSCLVSASLSCAMPCLQHYSHVSCLVSALLSCALPCLSITLVCHALSQLASRRSCSLKTPMCLACLFQLSMEASWIPHVRKFVFVPLLVRLRLTSMTGLGLRVGSYNPTPQWNKS